ncbi:hypothetical protein [Kitasatospora purpeofusca]|uniref:hypothetical protein n=1 Tax=Kitasatospora purpeofusca TaxID=67352 RepID=UPI0036D266B5
MDELNDTAGDSRGLSATFDQAMGGVGADLGPLVVGAAEQGRRIRRRRRTAVTGALAAVAVLTAGGAVALQPGDGSAAGGRIQAAAGSASSTSEQPVPGTGANAGKVALTGHAALQAVIQALPPGSTTSGYSGSSTVATWNDTVSSTTPWPEPGKFYAEGIWGGPDRPGTRSRGTLSYDDGNGPATVTVAVNGGVGDSDDGESSSRAQARSNFDHEYSCAIPSDQYQHCSDTVLPDGSLLFVTEQAEGDRLARTAELLRPDFTQVRIRVTNTVKRTDAPGYTQTRSGLPLSLDQVKAIAMSTGFQEWITPEAAQQAEQAVQPFHEEPLSTPQVTSTRIPATPPTGDPAPVR